MKINKRGECMKKIRCLSIILILVMLSQTFVFAAKQQEVYSENVQMAMVCGGKVALFEKVDTVLGTPPFKADNSLMLPARYLFENYGYEVSYENETFKAVGEKEISLAKNSNMLNVNGETKELPQASQIVNDTFFVPADICKSMGLTHLVTANGVFVILKDVKKTEFNENILIKLQGVYVSTDGNDSYQGTPAQPVAGMEAAKKIAMRYLGDFGRSYTVRIFVKGGTYRFSSGVNFDDDEIKHDSYKGLSIENYDKNLPEFTGTVEINSEGFVPVQDAMTLAKLPKKGRGNVAVLDLAAQGITDLKQLPNIFHYLYLNDIEQTNARWPNVGEATVFSVPQTNSFTFSETDPTRWTEAKNAYVFGHFSKAGWEWHQGIIQSVNPVTKTITITGATTKDKMISTAAGTTWYAQNLLEELDMPGEWYVDTEAKKLYYYPPYRLKDQKLEILKCTDTLLTFNNAKNVSIKGINFTKCYQALNFKGDDEQIKNITVQQCKFSHSQAYTTVEFPNGSRVYDISILENDAYNLFGRFCYFRAGNVPKLKDGNCIIKNNRITQVAQYYKQVGAIGMPYQTGNFGSIGVTVENNVIQDVPGGSAISAGGTRQKILYNEIVNAGKYMSDYGAIYCGRSASFYDLEVAHNFLHNFNNTNNYNGLYNDDGYANAKWHHNVMVDMYQPCIQAPGFNVEYTYNVAVNTAKTGSIGSRKSYGNSIYYNGTIWTEAKKMFYDNEEVYRQQYPQGFDWLERDKEFYDVSWDSVYFGNVGIGSTHVNDFGELLEYGAKEIERNGEAFSIEGMNGQLSGNPKYDYSDDIFVDIENMNYNINPESQVAKDFPELLEIDVTKSGITEDALYLMKKPSEGSRLVYPDNGQKGLNASAITFSWDPVKGASFYRIIVATDPKLENVIYDREIRENGNYNQITLENFENNCVYYWKVIAKSVTRQNMFEIDSVGGPYAFKTAMQDTLDKDNLRLAITAFETFVKEDLNNPDYEFDAEFKAQAEKKLEEVNAIYRTARTQSQIDGAEEEIYYLIKKSPFFMKLHFENLSGVYDENAQWQTTGNVIVDDEGVLTFSSPDGGRANAKTAINNRNSVVCFQMKLADLGNAASNYQGFDIKMSDAGRGYLIIFKHDIIEWQRINATLTEIPNDFIEAGKWYDVQAGGINTPNGVLQFFRVDGRIIYAELDQTANQTRDEGWFQIRKNQLGSIQIRDSQNVPEDSIIIDDVLNAFKEPRSDKHLQTLFIGSSDAMEMGSSQIFAKLDKSKLASVVYPIVQEREVNATREDVSEYKKILEEACVITGYNQGLSDLIFKNKIGFNYNDIIKVESIDTNGVTIYAGYNTMTDKFKSVTTDMMINGNCKTIDELRIHIAKCMLLGTINACYTGFAGQSEYISRILTKENADYIGIDISDYLALSAEDKLKANDAIGNGPRGDTTRTLDELVEDIHEAVNNLR